MISNKLKLKVVLVTDSASGPIKEAHHGSRDSVYACRLELCPAVLVQPGDDLVSGTISLLGSILQIWNVMWSKSLGQNFVVS
jgi:hypothetical protein